MRGIPRQRRYPRKPRRSLVRISEAGRESRIGDLRYEIKVDTGGAVESFRKVADAILDEIRKSR